MYFTEKMTMKKKLLEDGSIMSKSKGPFFLCIDFDNECYVYEESV